MAQVGVAGNGRAAAREEWRLVSRTGSSTKRWLPAGVVPLKGEKEKQCAGGASQFTLQRSKQAGGK